MGLVSGCLARGALLRNHIFASQVPIIAVRQAAHVISEFARWGCSASRSLRPQEGFQRRRVGSEVAARARSLRTQVCLQYDAKQVAVASLFLAFEELKLAQLRVGGREWWSVADALHSAMTCEQMLGARPLYEPQVLDVILHRLSNGLQRITLIYLQVDSKPSHEQKRGARPLLKPQVLKCATALPVKLACKALF